jgi:hypothetical protein
VHTLYEVFANRAGQIPPASKPRHQFPNTISPSLSPSRLTS